MQLPLESVPNVSEGRDRGGRSTRSVRALCGRARLLDVHTDVDHNRSVFTLVGDERQLVDALLAGIACARERIDLRAHARRASPDRRGRRRADRAACVLRTWSVRVRPALELAGANRRRARPAGLPLRRARAGPRAGVLPARRDGGAAAPDRRGRDRAGLRAVAARIRQRRRHRRRPPAADRVQRQSRRRERRGGAGDRARHSRARRRLSRACARSGSSCREAGHAQVSMNVEDWEASALHEIVARDRARGGGARRARSRAPSSSG